MKFTILSQTDNVLILQSGGYHVLTFNGSCQGIDLVPYSGCPFKIQMHGSLIHIFFQPRYQLTAAAFQKKPYLLDNLIIFAGKNLM